MAPVTTMLSHTLNLAVDDQSTLLRVNWHSPARDAPLVIEQRLVAMKVNTRSGEYAGKTNNCHLEASHTQSQQTLKQSQ